MLSPDAAITPQQTGMNTERLRRMRAAMEREGLDALVCRLPENVVLLSGYWPLCGWVFYIVPLEGRPICILPNTEEAEAAQELWDAEVMMYRNGTLDAEDQFVSIRKALVALAGTRGWKSIGYEGDFENIAPAWNAAELYVPAERTRRMLADAFGQERLKDATRLLLEQRVRKTPYEIEKLRLVNDISRIALEAFREGVAPGVSGVELAAAVEAAVMVKGTGYGGATKVRAFAQVAIGPAETAVAYRPMEVTTVRKLQQGDLALLELAVVADGWWSDRTRARVAGGATDRQLEINELVRRSQETAVAAVKAGVTGGEIDAVARAIIEEAGFGASFPHITGHALGICYHEPFPMLLPGCQDVLEEGVVHSVEPGIYMPDFGGIRIEDDILVTDSGHEVLGAFPKDL